ncbi:Crp/Fnr family transcriptional regulator [Fulvivirga kasyanovii]|uniref:Crp/Fnr family transcriptional regulator n=1 Tax=Fulvivirga kasyanovii TaxID=396812 RepID=A0ABW9RQ20_9BACT|nr:Crp/Fnr family transcriptional regulator [Fulvivirga kasyanovii]MTI26257.1 Crp/Fnr family transcriptional regulator [Fulvivirga kasyanovii]
MDCFNCHNNHCIIKRNLNEKLRSFVERKSTIRCKKGQTFIIEGSPVHGLYFVQEGKVKVAKTGFNGKEQIVRFTGHGETIGHRGFGAGLTYQINAVALEDAVLCNFSNDILKEMLMEVPLLTYDLMIFYAEELNRSETKVKKFAQMTVREKVIDVLLYINRKFGRTNDALNLQLSRREISDFAGTTEEQVIRTLSALRKEGLIETPGKHIVIKNVELLSKEISEHNYFIYS